MLLYHNANNQFSDFIDSIGFALAARKLCKLIIIEVNKTIIVKATIQIQKGIGER